MSEQGQSRLDWREQKERLPFGSHMEFNPLSIASSIQSVGAGVINRGFILFSDPDQKP